MINATTAPLPPTQSLPIPINPSEKSYNDFSGLAQKALNTGKQIDNHKLPSRFTWKNLTAIAAGVALIVGGIAAIYFELFLLSFFIVPAGGLIVVEGVKSMYNRKQAINHLEKTGKTIRQLQADLETLDQVYKQKNKEGKNLAQDSMIQMLDGIEEHVDQYSDKSSILNALRSTRIACGNPKVINYDTCFNFSYQAMKNQLDTLTEQYNDKCDFLGTKSPFPNPSKK